MPDFRTFLWSALVAGTALSGLAFSPAVLAQSQSQSSDKPAAQPTVPAPVADEGKSTAGSDVKTSDPTPASEKPAPAGEAVPAANEPPAPATSAQAGAAVQPESAEADLARGAYIAMAADCVACHAKPGGKPFAGGLKIATPMGDVIATNITPDPEHGIGHYTEAEFENAVRHGVRNDGAYLYPVMPYVSYAGMTDQDVKALYAWFMHVVKPVADAPEETNLVFPASLRSAMVAWNFVTSKEQPETGDSSTYDKLRRGRYLANALEHCGTCHTPRNFMLSEKQDHYLAGGSLGAWYAPNITSSKTGGIGNWSEDDLVAYLRTGHVSGRAQAAGPMGEAVEHSTSHLTDEDLHALAAFILKVAPMDDDADHTARDGSGKALDVPDIRTKGPQRIDDLAEMDGPHLYDANCAACHGADGAGTRDHYVPSLFNNSTVGAGRPDNLIMTILKGVDRTAGKNHAFMPGFDGQSNVQRLSDAEIAALVNYLTTTFGTGDLHVTPEQIKALRNDAPSETSPNKNK
ncbi:c-type cytochrome [Acetobacter orleanensis]|uniref:Cytochrome c n=1 Tax=Acetobacter orleanensis TaxID=104099 RepID=A0A4Y3TNV0_9PROT|nr:cytochrome c [Acetobacter orleanensis]KXV65412.1 sorbitol dehydrogenase [Acetobacter orleanensis]PCD80108.1 sorbitol dehydrogenase [Acetobacter orleanensis]GAN68448.1 alcohol dehydrogenase cytochrome c [Acetobacter orleanensis JCM 7639]GBR22789.1 sorbitol dehydrogenase cytochrome c subunit [Acetobacter orleanensis NRIC 0473]GEB82707.1 cytochrome c [Acetobacter orleanensis]